MRSPVRWALGFSLALGCTCLLTACGGGAEACTLELIRSFSLITVLAPDGARVCDADVRVDGQPATIQPGSQDADCAYAIDNGSLGDGAHEVIARKAGYLDAQGTIHVSGGSGGCPNTPPDGENITLHLVPTEAGVPEGDGDAGLVDASSDGL